MNLLTKEMQESYGSTKICYICKEKCGNKWVKLKVKLEIIVIIQGNIEALYIALVI